MTEMRSLAPALAALMLLGGAGLAAAHSYQRKSIEVVHPWTSEKAERSSGDVVVGMTLRNNGKAVERLVGVRTSIAARAEIRQQRQGPSGFAGAPALRLEIRPGQEVHLKASAMHIRLMGLKKALVAYDTLPVTLVFERSGAVTVDVLVEEIAAEPAPAKPSSNSSE